MDGRWGTVCNSNQEEIAGAVCSQLELPTIGSMAFVTLLPSVHTYTRQSARNYVWFISLSTLFASSASLAKNLAVMVLLPGI